MHTQPLPPSDGTFRPSATCLVTCPRCGNTRNNTVRTWDSDDGAYTDFKYHCAACRHVWWVDGPDS